MFCGIMFFEMVINYMMTWRIRTAGRKVDLKSFNARLANDYSAYSIVICQVI